MKKFPAFLLACALLFPAALSAATFEGSLRMKMSSGAKSKPMEMDYLLKENRVRVNPLLAEKGASGMGIIMDFVKMETTVLMPEQRMYMVTSMKATMDKVAQEAAKKESDATLEKTGEKEKILGYTCEKYLMKSKDGDMAMWLTDQLGTFMGLGSNAQANAFGGGRRAKGQTEQAWEKALAGKNMFPLRVVGLGTDGKETYRMDVTAIDKKSLPDSEFQPPADWKKFEMPNMGDMMRGMIPGR
jgi:hypothetical protein